MKDTFGNGINELDLGYSKFTKRLNMTIPSLLEILLQLYPQPYINTCACFSGLCKAKQQNFERRL